MSSYIFAPTWAKSRGEVLRVVIARIPSRHYSIRKVLTVELDINGMPEKISICLNRGREDSVGNDDVSIVRARKY